ncbi:alpha/beta hydrolase family protein [Frankia nepalensis]|uniref:alpha/beta hydrolase family protein n=1 Tax=Frankia nepalensis TaxID=1836974 RepID=UPI0027DDB834|nr:alpha/beta fold hydrolase [Frankia nepalensis]
MTIPAAFADGPAAEPPPAACAPAAEHAAVNPVGDPAGPDAPPAPDEPGSRGVGYRTVTIVDQARGGRVLATSVWYPSRSRLPAPARAAVMSRETTPASYEIVPNVGLRSRVAVADAPPEAGPFPLVVFSHGSAGSRVQFASLAEALASHGYVVAAPDHVGDTMADAAAGRSASMVALASDRPLDVRAVLDWMLCAGHPFASMARPDQVAVIGFSFGGLTAVTSTIGFLRAPADPRVRAVVAMSPATEVLSAELLGRVRVPTLLLGGTDDGLTPVERNADRTFRGLTGAADRMEVVVPTATHNSFSDLCDQAYLAGDARVPKAIQTRLRLGALVTCVAPMVDAAQARQVARWYTVAYLERHLRGDTRYDRYLAPDGASALAVPVTVRTAP